MDTPEELEKKIDGLLRDPDLLEKFVKELDKIIPQEYDKKKLLLLVLASRHVENKDEYLHTIINSSSSAGKSFWLKQYKKLLYVDDYADPELNEESQPYRYWTRVTPMALAYYKVATKKQKDGDGEPFDWKGKMLFLEDVTKDFIRSDVFKVFSSEGATTLTVREGFSQDLRIKGRPTIMLTVAEFYPNDEIVNRFILVDLDESPEQTRRIFIADAAGIPINLEYKRLYKKLNDYYVEIPYIEKIAKIFPNNIIRARRDWRRFLTLIRASAILHQYQREISKNGHLLANFSDLRIAEKLLVTFFMPTTPLHHLTKKQKQAYFDLLDLKKRLQKASSSKTLPSLTLDEDLETENSVSVCSCGSVAFCVRCIYTHYPNRTIRSWERILEKLAEKGCVSIHVVRNPDTKRDITIFTPLKTAENADFSLFEDVLNDGTPNNNNTYKSVSATPPVSDTFSKNNLEESKTDFLKGKTDNLDNIGGNL